MKDRYYYGDVVRLVNGSICTVVDVRDDGLLVESEASGEELLVPYHYVSAVVANAPRGVCYTA